MERIAIFPGSFDPITLGHVEIIQRGLQLFDKIVVGIGINTSKQTMYDSDKRAGWIRHLFADEPRVEVRAFSGLTVQFAQQHHAQFLLRGLRASPDFEYEKNIDLLNQHLDNGIQTVYLISSPKTGHISSTLVREVIRFGGNLDGLVPSFMATDIYANMPPSGRE